MPRKRLSPIDDYAEHEVAINDNQLAEVHEVKKVHKVEHAATKITEYVESTRFFPVTSQSSQPGHAAKRYKVSHELHRANRHQKKKNHEPPQERYKSETHNRKRKTRRPPSFMKFHRRRDPPRRAFRAAGILVYTVRSLLNREPLPVPRLLLDRLALMA